MKIALLIVCCAVSAVAAQNATEEQPVVNAPIGPIRGSFMTSRLGKKIYSFRGVRYGESPTGHQRFQVSIIRTAPAAPSFPHAARWSRRSGP